MFDKPRAVSFAFIEAISSTLGVVRAPRHQSRAGTGLPKSYIHGLTSTVFILGGGNVFHSGNGNRMRWMRAPLSEEDGIFLCLR